MLQYTKDESLQWCSLRFAHNYPLLLKNKKLTRQNYRLDCIPHQYRVGQADTTRYIYVL